MTNNSAGSPDEYRFTLKQLFYYTAVVCVYAAIYAEYGVQGFERALLYSPVALIGYGIVWRSRSIILVFTAIQVVFATLDFAYPEIRIDPWYRRMACADNLKAIGKARHQQHSEKTEAPKRVIRNSKGRPLLSWRVAILPYLDLSVLKARFRLSESWDSSHNRALLSEGAERFHCRLDRGQGSSPIETSYLAAYGPNSACDENQFLPFDQITDGLSNTILVVESHTTGIAWSEPRDWEAETQMLRVNGDPVGLSSGHGPSIRYYDGSHRIKQRVGCNVLMADGSVQFLTNDIDPEVLRSMILRNDGKPR